MAAPNDSGYGLGVQEDTKTVDVDDVKRQGPKIVTDVAGESEGVEKNGSEASPDGAGSDEKSHDEQVAKKPRVEKAENGEAEKAGDTGYGVASLDGVVDKEGEGDGDGVNGGGVNGSGEEGVEEENGAGEEHAAGDGVTAAKDAAPGDVGLRTLLQEGDVTKTSVAHHGADAAHMINAAK